jgi:hypothetical protein
MPPEFWVVPVSKSDSAKHVNCHELHRPSHVSPTTSLATDHGKIEINQHARTAVGSFGVGNNDFVLGDISMQGFRVVYERLIRRKGFAKRN